MTNPPPALLPELPEDRARGAIAVIYGEICRFSGVPYVSSLQRYLATMPGVLEWAWSVVRPAMLSGAIPETGWRLAETVRISPLPMVDGATLRDWGVDAAGLAAVRAIAANFLRVSPVNLMTGACLKLVLTGTVPSAAGGSAATGSKPAPVWTPPMPLPPMPGNVDPSALPQAQRAALLRFATEVDGTPFIPALYRQLAHWPSLLAWLADALVPRLVAPETNAARAAFRAAALAAAPAVVAGLPALPPGAPPDPATTHRVLAAIDRYATTSPEMTMFGRLLLEALPEQTA